MKKQFRLPFRVKVPERDELIAFALATLAVGLMVGLAIGPMVNGAARIIPVIIPGPAVDDGTVEGETVAAAPPLGSPAGSDLAGGAGPDDGSTLVSDPIGEPVAAAVEEPDEPVSAPEPTNNSEPAPRGENPPETPRPEPEGALLSGTVLANAPSSRTYWLSADGELTTVFAATVPDPGLTVSTRVTPLSNGTLAQSGQRSAVDITKESTLKAVVSYLDPVAGIVVLSSRGGSLPVATTDPAVLAGAELGNRIEATLNLEVPDPENYNETAEPTDPGSLAIRLMGVRQLRRSVPVELTGSVLRADETSGTLTITADSTGILGSKIELGLPEGFPFGIVTAGRMYSVTATSTADGLRVVGLSAASGKAAADDPARAFGSHLSGGA